MHKSHSGEPPDAAQYARPDFSDPATADDLERFVRRVVGEVNPPSWLLDDALQGGRIAVWQASLRYDPARGATFKTFAYRRIRTAAVRTVTAEMARPEVMYLSEFDEVDPEEGPRRQAFYIEAGFERIERQLSMPSTVPFTLIELGVLRMLAAGYTRAEIARRRRVARSTVTAAVKRIARQPRDVIVAYAYS